MSDEVKSGESAPQAWSDFFDGTMKKLTALVDARRDARRQAALTPAKQVAALRAAVARGQRARNFLSSDFWAEDLEPFLRAEAALKPWAPGDPLPLAEVSTRYLYNSGKVYMLTLVLKQVGKWVEAGDEAARALAADAEKNKSLR